MNGFVRKNGKYWLWISKRSKKKKSFPGIMDTMVAAAQVWLLPYLNSSIISGVISISNS
jgi:hypothetical protein